MSHRYPLVSNYRNTFSIMKKKQHLHRLTYKSDVEKKTPQNNNNTVTLFY